MNTELEARVTKLEAAARRWRRGFLALLAVATLIVVAQPSEAKPTSAKTLQVGGLELVDEHGVVRARLGVEEDGTAGLTVFGATEKSRRAILTVGDTGAPALLLRNGKGKAQFIASLGSGGPSLLLCNPAGDLGTSLTMKDDNGTSLLGMRLPGEKGLRAVFTVMEDGRPYVKLRGPKGQLRVWARPEIEFQPAEED